MSNDTSFDLVSFTRKLEGFAAVATWNGFAVAEAEAPPVCVVGG